MTNDDEIDRLILELHATGGASASSGDLARIEGWLRLLASRNGSDLLLVAGAPPSIRVDGRIQPLAEGPLDGADARCEQKTFDLQIDEPWDGTGCGIGVERRENEMPCESRMHTDMRRFRIAHLPHHDHVWRLSNRGA